MSSAERILGEIPVATKLALGSERMSLFMTDSRILVAHVGKRGAGAAVSINLLGKLSGALEELFKSHKESVGKRRMKSAGVKEILAADKDNFSIRFDEVVNVSITQGASLTGLMILTGSDKFEFSTRLPVDRVVELFTPSLAPKLILSKIR
jgi:hypothetical protein